MKAKDKSPDGHLWKVAQAMRKKAKSYGATDAGAQSAPINFGCHSDHVVIKRGFVRPPRDRLDRARAMPQPFTGLALSGTFA